MLDFRKRETDQGGANNKATFIARGSSSARRRIADCHSRGVGGKGAGAARAAQVARRLPSRVLQLELGGLADGAGQVERGACTAGAAAAAGGSGAGARPGGCRRTAASLLVCRLLRRCLGPQCHWPARDARQRQAQ